jgi:CheY-like chemotaxis protein
MWGRAKPLLVLAEDCADTRAMYREQLCADGFDVVPAADGLEAMDAVHTRRPDVVVLDLSLPRLTGWEVARRLFDHPATRAIPIVAVTAHASHYAADRARWAGCHRVLVKPIAPAKLAREIHATLAARSVARAPERSRPRALRLVPTTED